jgi:hypothetical protein
MGFSSKTRLSNCVLGSQVVLWILYQTVLKECSKLGDDLIGRLLTRNLRRLIGEESQLQVPLVLDLWGPLGICGMHLAILQRV